MKIDDDVIMMCVVVVVRVRVRDLGRYYHLSKKIRWIYACACSEGPNTDHKRVLAEESFRP